MRVTASRLRKFVQAIVKESPKTPKALYALAEEHHMSLQKIGQGASRRAYLITKTPIVLKIAGLFGEDDYFYGQGKKEFQRILVARKRRGLRRFLPKIYLYGCHFDTNIQIVAMRYYPLRCHQKDIDKLEDLFPNVFDVHNKNIRRTSAGYPKLIDLGV